MPCSARDLVVVTGKGGVGKSTVAAALGLVAAGRGLRTIVAEVARRDDVSRALGGEGMHEEELAPGLHHLSIDPEHAMELYLADQLPSALADLLASSRTFSYLAAATPGMRELLTVGKVWELAQDDRRTPGAEPYDLVVLDAPATGHGVAVLSAPRTFAADRARGPHRPPGPYDRRDALRPANGRASSPWPGPRRCRSTRRSRCRTRCATSSASRSSSWSCNGMLPQRFTAADARALDAAPDGPEVRAARHAHARARRPARAAAAPAPPARAPRSPTLPSRLRRRRPRWPRLARELERAL